METRELAQRVDRDTEDVLATISLVSESRQLTDHLFSQLVDLLLEGVLVDLRMRETAGELSPVQYAEEIAVLVGQCRAAGLDGRS